MTQLTLDMPMIEAKAPGAATGAVAGLLRAEGAAAFGASLVAYQAMHGSWLVFALLFLVPDLSMLGYLAGRRTGAAAYNLGHSYLSPAALAAAGLILQAPWLFGPALIWAAHIGFDRLLGYGLKYAAGFKVTHLSVKV
jgi:hypothetical protein